MRLHISLAADNIADYQGWRDYTPAEMKKTGVNFYDLPLDLCTRLVNGAPKKNIPRSYFRAAQKTQHYHPYGPRDVKLMSAREKSLYRAIKAGTGVPWPIMTVNHRTKKFELIDGWTRAGIVDGAGGVVRAAFLSEAYIETFLREHRARSKKGAGVKSPKIW